MYNKSVNQKRLYLGVIVVFFACFFIAGCGEGDSAEDQIRQFVAAGELAAESRSIGGIKELISEKYADDHKRTRRELVAVAMRYFYANRDIHLFTRIKELHFLSEKRAILQLYVAMSGKEVSDKASLMNVQADLYRFELELMKEGGDWKLMRADWQSAIRNDFF